MRKDNTGEIFIGLILIASLVIVTVQAVLMLRGA